MILDSVSFGKVMFLHVFVHPRCTSIWTTHIPSSHACPETTHTTGTSKPSTPITLGHAAPQLRWISIQLECFLVTTHERSLGQANIFTSVCQEFCSWGGEEWYPSMHCRWYPSMPCSRSPGGWYPSMPCRFPGPHPEGVSLGGSDWGVSRPTPKGEVEGDLVGGISRPTPREVLLPGWGCLVLGGCCRGGCLVWGMCGDPPGTATAVGGTYPTGMHSC